MPVETEICDDCGGEICPDCDGCDCEGLECTCMWEID